MSARVTPRVLTIHPGAPFLSTLAEALKSGRLVPGFKAGDSPLALAGVTIYVPTRRAARELRAAFVETSGSPSAILPTIRALGEFDDAEAILAGQGDVALKLAPPIAPLDRILLLAPLVRAWKQKLPAFLRALFDEEVIIPASSADALWLARDLAALMDEVELEGSDWSKLTNMVTGDLANWWQVTLDFLEIVTKVWPGLLAAHKLSNPAAHRDSLLRAEAERLRNNPPSGPVIAAGSTGSIPGTAELLAVIANLPNGAVVLPGLDTEMDKDAWELVAAPLPEPSVFGHPQYGLARLLAKLGLTRDDVTEIATLGQAQADRATLVSEAMRPADATDVWLSRRDEMNPGRIADAFGDVALIQAANERDEAAGIAVALRMAIEESGKRAALVTADRNLARRVSTELLRFGIVADDSGGSPLANHAPATLLRLMVLAAIEPGDPVVIVSLLKHPLLRLGFTRGAVIRFAEIIELVALRGGTGRPDAASLEELFGQRLADMREKKVRRPHWFDRVDDEADDVVELLRRLSAALAPLTALRIAKVTTLAGASRATVEALEALGRDELSGLADLYAGDAGAQLIDFLREITGAGPPFDFAPAEWPAVLEALIAPQVVKPAQGSDPRVSIWGALEARLQHVDTLVLGGLNEGSWPRKPQTDRLMSRIMKSGIDLEPPERRIGLAAHDFQMAMGAPKVILTRSAREGDAPAVASRWLQRLDAFIGADAFKALVARGETYLGWAKKIDDTGNVDFAPRPNPTPPLESRPKHLSITEIETLRRDPYAIYARHVLQLHSIDALIRDPGAAERGTLFHEILHRFSQKPLEADDASAMARLIEIGEACFDEEALTPDVRAVWWPRFVKLADKIVEWERGRAGQVISRHSEVRADRTEVGATGVTLSGRADRIDLLASGHADILDFKTGSSPSKTQAHTLLAPQLPLEAALLQRGAFAELGRLKPDVLAYVRLKANGEVEGQSILTAQVSGKESKKSGPEIAEESWRRLEELLIHYNNEGNGYLSRALPFKEGDFGGDYDHLARVLEWSAGGDAGGEEGSE